MRCSTLRGKIRHLFEIAFTGILFSTQTILNAGWAISVMTIPLLPYLVYLTSGDANIEREIAVLFFSKYFIVGRIIALIGIVVLAAGAVQLLLNRRRGIGLIETGAYSIVRHPQFTGIIILTMGLTVMVLTLGGNSVELTGLWLLQILGYIGIARYEEVHLLKRFGESFQQYRQKVPFIFPIKCPSRIPETVLTVVIAFLIGLILLLFPYNLIRII
jgi:protein-S-isoprenylcysteine O-methyltransferase Ste14